MAEKPTKKAPETKADLPVQFSDQELEAIANEIFKSESGVVNKAVKFYTGQKQLEDYQRVLLAPANAFEGLITFGISILSGKAAEDIATLVDSVSDEKTRTMLWNIIKKGWGNCTKTEQVAFIAQFISTILISGGALSKLGKIIPADKFAALQKSATAKRLRILAAAVVASPADEITTAFTPAIGQITQINRAKVRENKLESFFAASQTRIFRIRSLRSLRPYFGLLKHFMLNYNRSKYRKVRNVVRNNEKFYNFLQKFSIYKKNSNLPKLPPFFSKSTPLFRSLLFADFFLQK